MYVVVGAGLAGMAAALTLQKSGAEVTVVESSDRAGGRVATDYIDGFTLDRGFQLINANYSEVKRWNLLEEIDFKIAPRSVGVATDTGIVRLGDPRSALLSIFSARSGSIYAKASFLRYLASAPKVNESVQDHFLRTGVEDLYRKVLKPFLSGVFLADPAKVSAIIGREVIGSFINGRSGIPSNGVGDLAAKMAGRIKDLRLNTQVEEIGKGGVETGQGFIAAERIILATDLTTAGQLLDAKEVGRLTGSTTWYHATTQAPTDNAELIIDSEGRGPVVNSIVISNLSKAYAPIGQHLISSTTITHASESEVRRQLAQMWGRSTADWRFLAKYEINSALPLFQPGYAKSSQLNLAKNIYCAGDYLASPSQNGALLSGRKAAEQLLIDQRG
jgi:protoporphyrinogen oxidase